MPIIQSISRFVQTLQIPITTASCINRQKKFFRKNVDPQLADAKKNHDGSPDENDLKKISDHYGLIVPAILGEAICALRGEPMTKKERLVLSNLAAMSALADDFFDEQILSEQGLKDFIEKPQEFTGKTSSQKLFLHFYNTALANAPQPTQIKEQFYKLFFALQLSKQQDGPGLSYEVIKDITMRKGGELMMFYRTAFKHPFKHGEEKMLYSFGGLIQISNDILDVYEDHKNGVSTVVTTAIKTQELRFHYAALLQIAKEAAFRSGYPKKNARKFLGIIFFGIFSRSHVCLDRLKKIEKRTYGNFDLKSYSRKDLTCDMSTVGNKLKALRYYFKLSRRPFSPKSAITARH